MADLSSKVSIVRLPPSLQSIIGVPSNSIHMTGTSLKGPIGEVSAVPAGSWPTWKRIYGGLVTTSYLPISVWAIMRAPRGTKRIFTTRITHFTDPDDKLTTSALVGDEDLDGTTAAPTQGAETGTVAGPWNLDTGDDLVIHCDEDGSGPDTATFTGTPALVVGGAWVGGLLAADQLTIKTDKDPDDQVIIFAGGETFQQTIDKLNTVNGLRAVDVGPGTSIDLQSDTEGTNGSIWIKAESPSGVAAKIGHVVVGSATTGGGNVGDIDAVTFTEAKPIIEAAVVNPATGVTCTEEVGGFMTVTSNKVGGGPTSSIQIEVASKADAKFGFDNALHQGSAVSVGPVLTVQGINAGGFTDDIMVDVEAATDGEAAHFKLKVYYQGELIETWDNLSMTTTDPEFHETVINNADVGSAWINTVDLATGTRPDNVTGVALTGGDDGLTGLVDGDFTGNAGIWSTRFLPDFIALRAVPGRATAVVQNALVSMCELTNSFAVMAGPLGQTVSGIRTYFKTTAALKELSEFGAFYWPNVKIANPDTDIYGTDDTEIVVPAEGPCLGTYTVNDSRAGGVYEAPAGLENGQLFGVTDVENEQVYDEAVRDQLYPDRINPIWHMADGEPFFIDGSRTLKSTGPFPSIGESRGVIFITQSIKVFAERVRHRNITLRLLDEVGKSVQLFLIGQARQGAFFSDDPEKAFYVDTSEAVNPASERAAHRLHIYIGLAMAEPAEFIFIEVTKDTRALLEELGL